MEIKKEIEKKIMDYYKKNNNKKHLTLINPVN